MAVIELEKSLKVSTKQILNNTVSAGYTNRTSGRLANSWAHEKPVLEDKKIIGRVGNPVSYARIHEEGGTLMPTRSAALTVPIAGHNFGTARDLKETGETFVRRDVVFLKRGDSIIPIFALRRNVNIPARRYITEGVRRATPRIEALMGENVGVEIEDHG